MHFSKYHPYWKKWWEGFGLFRKQPLLWNQLVALMTCTREVKLGSESGLLHYEELLESFRNAIQNLWQVRSIISLSCPRKSGSRIFYCEESHAVKRSNFCLVSTIVLIIAVGCAAYNFILTLGCCIKPLCHMGGLEQKTHTHKLIFKF